MKERIRIQGMLIFLATLLAILLSKNIYPSWEKEPLDEFLDMLGLVMVLFGFLFRIAARGYKEDKSCASKSLVKDGPYGLVRNPMYFGTFMIGTGIIFILFAFWVFPLFMIIFLALYIPQIKKEEKELFKRFGEGYKDYCKITPKYFPRIQDFLNIRNYISLRLSWIKKELVSVILVIVIVFAIEVWKDVRLFGFKEFLKEPFELLLIILSFIILVTLFIKKEDYP